jgi:hypothetical protein
VFLLSVRSGAVGINLTAANHVFLLEPCLNPALEEQAIGKIVVPNFYGCVHGGTVCHSSWLVRSPASFQHPGKEAAYLHLRSAWVDMLAVAAIHGQRAAAAKQTSFKASI